MEYFCAAKCASSIPDLLLEREKAHNEALEKENEPAKIVFSGENISMSCNEPNHSMKQATGIFSFRRHC